MKSYQHDANLTRTARHAGVDRKTVAKYVHGQAGPEEPRSPRRWRTHTDAFAEVWTDVEACLLREPLLQAKTLFAELLRQYPGRFGPGQQRTFERRVRGWKRRHGPEPELFFRQEHRPGDRVQLDWFSAHELAVCLEGAPFEHLLVHAVLPYSNWEWARVAHSESFLSWKCGLQSALFELDGVPRYCQTDASSTATHARGRATPGRDFNARYLSVLAHFGLQPAVIGVGEPHENGDCESAHRHLRQAIDQALRLRGSREFGSLNAYEAWLFELLRQRNGQRAERVERERRALRSLALVTRLPEYEELTARVSREALVRVGKVAYSVPARYAGEVLRVQGSETEVAFYWNGECVARSERRRGQGGTCIDWRHVLAALARKPGALRDWRYREAMFPNVRWRALYDLLAERFSVGRAEREYLGILALGLHHRLEALEQAVEALGTDVSLDQMRRRFCPTPQPLEPTFRADLSSYDQLLGSGLRSQEAA